MEMTQLLPELRRLNHAQKLYVMQFLVAEIAHETGEGDRAGVTYPSGFTANVPNEAQVDTSHENGMFIDGDAVVADRKAALALIESGKFAPKRQGNELASDTFAKRKLIEKELEERRWSS